MLDENSAAICFLFVTSAYGYFLYLTKHIFYNDTLQTWLTSVYNSNNLCFSNDNLKILKTVRKLSDNKAVLLFLCAYYCIEQE